MSYFVATRQLTEQNIEELATAMELYSVARVPVTKGMISDERDSVLEQLKGPIVRRCIQRILEQLERNTTMDLNSLPSQFYQQQILGLIDELIHGSDDFNRKVVLRDMREQLRGKKDLPEKLYRQMVKEKFVAPDLKTAKDTPSKKVALMVNVTHEILNNGNERSKQGTVMELLNRMDV